MGQPEKKIEALEKQNSNLVQAIMRSNPHLNTQDFLSRVNDICEVDGHDRVSAEFSAHDDVGESMLRSASASSTVSQPLQR
ncbi:hypothetical protein GUITHDRAFT_156563, partial [Guillardia theta CCMP2712]